MKKNFTKMKSKKKKNMLNDSNFVLKLDEGSDHVEFVERIPLHPRKRLKQKI